MKLFYLTNGESIHDQRFIQKFKEKDYDTTLVSYSNRTIPIDYHGIRVIHYHPVPDWFPFSTYLNYFPFGLLHLRKLLRKEHPDIIHAGWVQHYGLISALSGFHPLLIIPWGSDIMVEPQKSFLHRIITRFVLRNADMIACDAQFVKHELITIIGYSRDIEVFPWGIDLNLFKSNHEDGIDLRERLGWKDKKVLIMTRLFYPVYGIEYFLEAVLRMVGKFPDVRIILCGNGPLNDKYNKYIKDHLLGKYFYFAGNVPNDKLSEYYNAADVYVSSSLSDGTSLSLLEAMACGLPVVVTDVPAILEWIKDGENGFVVPREDSKVLSGRLLQLLQDETKQKEFGNKNIKIAKERADWNKNFEKLARIYEFLEKNKK